MDGILTKIRNIIEEYIKNASLKSVVIGVSGGIDSALVVAIIRPICDKLNIPLIGRSITIDSNKIDERNRASNIGKHFCTDFKEVDLTHMFETLSIIDTLEVNCDKDLDPYKIRMGNIKARMRMIYLYNVAAVNNGIVMGTENLTEHYLGFFTRGGDEISDFEPIRGLWKTEVYQLSEHIANSLCEDKKNVLMSCVNGDATDGLGISTTDLDQILPDWKDRYECTKDGYEEVDDIFINHFNSNEFRSGNGVSHVEMSPVIQRYKRTDFKRNKVEIISIKN